MSYDHIVGVIWNAAFAIVMIVAAWHAGYWLRGD